MGIASFLHAPFAILFRRRDSSMTSAWTAVDIEAMVRRTPLENELLLGANDDWPGAVIQSPANDCEPPAPKPSRR
jgi:hypothetical protein